MNLVSALEKNLGVKLALLGIISMVAVACDDGGTTPVGPPAEQCNISPTLDALTTEYFEQSCTFGSCHAAAANPGGGLDLETDPHAALVGVPAVAAPAKFLVVAGDADNSFIVQKVEGTQEAGELSLMPLGSLEPVNPCAIQALRDWINAGAQK